MSSSGKFPGDEVVIQQGELQLSAFLYVPDRARGLVLFAHGSGSSRHSTRNHLVARQLADASLATLLLDLLTPSEDAVDQQTAFLRFNIPLLSERLLIATDWSRRHQPLKKLSIGYFGASTGAAAALVATSQRADVKTVVSRGGRPDLAGAALRKVYVPVLLIVGGNDNDVLRLNRIAAEQLGGPHEMLIIPRAKHLFEEPGTLEQVALAARDWFLTYL